MQLYRTILTGIFFLVLGQSGLKAQQGIVTAGGEATGIDGALSYTIGQTDYITSTGSDGIITQGLQQPYEIFVITGIEETNIQISFTLFPNPAEKFIILNAGAMDIKNMNFSLFDVQSKLLERSHVQRGETIISMEKLAMGTYYLKITDNNREVKTFKIVKLN